MTPNVLVNKTLTGVKIADDKKALLFQTTDGDVVARCDGDCCSNTWIETISLPPLGFPAVVVSVGNVEMPDLGGMPNRDVVAYYGLRVETDRGSVLIDYRNDSNGYYGGNLSWPGDYFYGGVDGQNESTCQWLELE